MYIVCSMSVLHDTCGADHRVELHEITREVYKMTIEVHNLTIEVHEMTIT